MSANLHKPPPRHYRLGGFRINNDTAVQWASHLKGRELHPVINRPTVRKAISDKVINSRINFRQVGEVSGVHWMFVTQSAPFKGYKGMDPSKIPQFEAGDRDAVTKEFLEEAGIKEYEFATVLD